MDSIHSYNYIKNVVITSQMNQRIWLSLLCS
nr:MAG TPA: molecular chaperone protein [Caudoviricetes sp.]